MGFIKQAQDGKNEWWRWLITILVVMSPFLLNFVIFFFLPDIFNELIVDTAKFKGNKNIFLIENLFPFVILLVLLLVFVKLLHERPIRSLLTSRKKIDWKRFFFGFFSWGIIALLFVIVGYFLNPEDYVWNFRSAPFFTLLFISFLLIPLQTSFEELLFRGYLMQGLGVLAKNRWFPLIITSILFGIMHILNPEVSKLGYGVLIFYIGTGLLFGIVTLLDEGTELALGMHAINNISTAVLAAADWAVFQTDALFIDVSKPSLFSLAVIPVFVIYPLYLFLLNKVYRWKNWKKKLAGSITKPP